MKKIDNQAFEGFETWTSTTRMKIKMHIRIIISLLFVQVLLFIVAVNKNYDAETKLTLNYYFSKAIVGLKPRMSIRLEEKNGSPFYITASNLVHNQYLTAIAHQKGKSLLFNFLKLGSIFILYPFIIKLFKKRAGGESGKYIRGSRLIDVSEYEKQIIKNKEKTDLPLGLIKMPRSAETRHTFLVGKPGVGKTVAIRAIQKRLIERSEKGLTYDYKGDYVCKFFDPERGDLLLNPLDPRCLGWNLFNEIYTYMDIDGVAASQIPPSVVSTDPFWNDGARAVLSGILHHCYQTEQRNNKAIWKHVIMDRAELANILKITKGGEAGHRFIGASGQDGDARQAEGILSVLMQYTKCYEYMQDIDGDFSIKEWLLSGKGFIYVTNYADVEDTIRPILSLFIDLLGRKALSMKNDINRRLFINIDELGTLQRLSSLIKMLTMIRGKGGCFLLGVQDIGQIDQVYTQNLRESIIGACGNYIYMTVDGKTAKFASDQIGDTEYMTTRKGYSLGVKTVKDGMNITEEIKTEPLFLSSDISNLQDLTAVVKIKNYHHVKSAWEYIEYPDITDGFQLRDDLVLSKMMEEQEKIKEEAEEAIETEAEINIESVMRRI